MNFYTIAVCRHKEWRLFDGIIGWEPRNFYPLLLMRWGDQALLDAAEATISVAIMEKRTTGHTPEVRLVPIPWAGEPFTA